MKLKPARRKRHCNFQSKKPFPILNINEKKVKYTGNFNGFCVTIKNFNEMNDINSMGFFGKGNLSRSFPNFNNQNKQTRKGDEEVSQISEEKVAETVEHNTNLENLNNEQQTVSSVETLNLSLEEAFYLSNFINCVNVYDYENKLLEKNQLWNLFARTQPNFIQNYAVYHYFRAKKWVVKSGIKFGGDFLLYKDGPPFYHASYVVIIDVISSDTYEQNKNFSQRSIEWINLIGLNRLTETAAKEVLICQVIWPTEITKEEAQISSEIIKQFSINTVLMRRWIAKHERKCK